MKVGPDLWVPAISNPGLHIRNVHIHNMMLQNRWFVIYKGLPIKDETQETTIQNLVNLLSHIFIVPCSSDLVSHCGLKVSRSQAKIYENFAIYFLKTKANNKCFSGLKCTRKGLQKSISELER